MTMIVFAILSGVLLLFLPATFGKAADSDIKNVQYSIEETSHTLITTWQVENKHRRISCDILGIQMFEISLSGRLKSLVYGQDHPDCTQRGDELILRHDLTRFKIKPFRSYKLCLSLPESHYDAGQCCPPFSLETFIPYNPEAASTSTARSLSSSTSTSQTTSTSTAKSISKLKSMPKDLSKVLNYEKKESKNDKDNVDSDNFADNKEGDNLEDNLAIPDDYYEFYDTSDYYHDQPVSESDENLHSHNLARKDKSLAGTSDGNLAGRGEISSARKAHKERLSAELARLIKINNEIKQNQDSEGKFQEFQENAFMKRSEKSLFPLEVTSSVGEKKSLSFIITICCLTILTYLQYLQ